MDGIRQVPERMRHLTKEEKVIIIEDVNGDKESCLRYHTPVAFPRSAT